MTKTLALAAAISLASLGLLAHRAGVADAQPIVRPTVTALPTFGCAATPDSATDGRATVTHENAVAVDATKIVTATVRTPSGPVAVEVCGSAFASEKTARIAFKIQKAEKGFVYTCTARQGTSPCDKPLH